MEKKLFKAILGEVMKMEYEEMSPKEVTVVALGAVTAFARQNGINLTCDLSTLGQVARSKQYVTINNSAS